MRPNCIWCHCCYSFCIFLHVCHHVGRQVIDAYQGMEHAFSLRSSCALLWTCVWTTSPFCLFVSYMAPFILTESYMPQLAFRSLHSFRIWHPFLWSRKDLKSSITFVTSHTVEFHKYDFSSFPLMHTRLTYVDFFPTSMHCMEVVSPKGNLV